MPPHRRRRLAALSSSALGTPPWKAPVPPAPIALPSSTDIAIVGAGLTGLFLATLLAGRGQDVVVIECAFGTGATTRSGGIVLGETLVGPDPRFDGCEEALRRWIVSRDISCGLAWNGCLELLRNASLDATRIDWHDSGAIRFSRMVNGGVVDPSELLGGVLMEARRAGARVVDGVAAESIEADGAGVAISTATSTLRARRVAMATDATLAPGGSDSADPWDERGITVAIKTAPLAAGVRATLGLEPLVAFYTDDLPLLWGRVMPDDSLLIGRELLPAAIHQQSLPASVSVCGLRLLDRVRGLHPALSGAQLERAWGGPVARTKAGVPIVQPDADLDRVTWLGGYGGHGIAQAFRVAEIAARNLE